MATDSRRSPEHGRGRLLRTTLLSVAVGVVRLTGIYALLRGVWGVGPIARPFDRRAWTAPDRHPGDRLERRARMLSNLPEGHLHPGRTRAEVEAPVGPPDPDPLLGPSGEGEWVYMPGSTRLGELRIMAWAFEDTDVDSPGAFGRASVPFEIRGLRMGSDERQRLERIQIVSM